MTNPPRIPQPPLYVSLIGVVLSMALRDVLGTKLIQAVGARRGWRAGQLDGAGDVAQVVCYSYGAGQVVLHGWTVYSIILLGAMAVTSCLTTKTVVDGDMATYHRRLKRFL